LEGLRYIVYAMKYDLEIRYHEAHRDKELREYLLVMLYVRLSLSLSCVVMWARLEVFR